MYNLKLSQFRRQVTCYFTPGQFPSRTGNPGYTTGGTTGDGSPLNQPVNPNPSRFVVQPDGTTYQAPNNRPRPKTGSNPQVMPQSQTTTYPTTGESLAKQAKAAKQKPYKPTKTKRQNNRRKKSPMDVPLILPPGRKPKEEMKNTSRDKLPEGQVDYRDGPRIHTDSQVMGKLGPIRTLKQTPDTSAGGSDKLGQVRTLIQIIGPRFLPQLSSYQNEAADRLLDATQKDILSNWYQQMRSMYLNRKSLNSTLEQTFTERNIFLYFYDVHALHAELVCLLQGAAYFLDSANGCDNVVLSRIGNTLTKNSFNNLRNEMARVLRFSYLPGRLIDETYEMFQTYRNGDSQMSGSMRFVTPLMGQLIYELGVAVAENSSTSSDITIHSAVTNYTQGIHSLSDLVKNGRSGNPGTAGNPAIERVYFNTTEEDPTPSDATRVAVNVFSEGEGAMTPDRRQTLNGIFQVIAQDCNLRQLNNINEGNSQSFRDDAMSDMWNNQSIVFAESESASGHTFYPMIIPGGQDGTVDKSPSHTLNTIYCSEVNENDIRYKSVQYMLNRFTGYGALFFVPESLQSPTLPINRYWMEETNPKTNLRAEDDIQATLNRDYANFTSGETQRPFVSNNYVTKLFRAASTWTSFNNPDGLSAGQWYLTLGELRDKQYNEGCDYLL